MAESRREQQSPLIKGSLIWSPRQAHAGDMTEIRSACVRRLRLLSSTRRPPRLPPVSSGAGGRPSSFPFLSGLSNVLVKGDAAGWWDGAVWAGSQQWAGLEEARGGLLGRPHVPCLTCGDFCSPVLHHGFDMSKLGSPKSDRYGCLTSVGWPCAFWGAGACGEEGARARLQEPTTAPDLLGSSSTANATEKGAEPFWSNLYVNA